MRVDAPGHWPYYQDREASVDGEVQVISIPRLADLTVEIRDANGQVVAGKPVEVWTYDYEKYTKHWQAAGAMEVAPEDWRTGADGRVSFDPFPEGNYRCSTVTDAGEAVSVDLEVRPGGENLALIVLP